MTAVKVDVLDAKSITVLLLDLHVIYVTCEEMCTLKLGTESNRYPLKFA